MKDAWRHTAYELTLTTENICCLQVFDFTTTFMVCLLMLDVPNTFILQAAYVSVLGIRSQSACPWFTRSHALRTAATNVAASMMSY